MYLYTVYIWYCYLLTVPLTETCKLFRVHLQNAPCANTVPSQQYPDAEDCLGTDGPVP